MSVLMNTHVLVWPIDGNERLGQESRQLVNTALREDLVIISAITFWEIVMPEGRGRLAFSLSVSDWRQRILDAGVVEIPVAGDIGWRSSGRPEEISLESCGLYHRRYRHLSFRPTPYR